RQREGEETVFYLTDHLGTVHDLANVPSNLVNRIEYSSFGNVVFQANQAAGDRFLFTGREYDMETGRYYYRTRTYDPQAGRFLEQDSLRFQAGDVNLNRYLDNNPLALTDPTGQSPLVTYTLFAGGFLG